MFARHLRRLRVRLQARRLGGDVWKLPDLTEAEIGFGFEQRQEAFAQGCRLLNLTSAGDAKYGYRRKSIGAPVRDANGSSGWLKIVGFRSRRGNWTGEAELTADSVADVPKPALLNHAQWSRDKLTWRALHFAFAPAAMVADTAWVFAAPRNLDEGWYAELKRAVGKTSDTPISRWQSHPGTIAKTIVDRFGSRAPFQVSEWRTAHGDLGWNNITAPELVLIDWEYWGAAPRASDAATLLTNSVMEPGTYRRIEELFADDLDTSSGLVARLYQIARRLSEIEAGYADPRQHRPLEAEAGRLLRR
jgi:hypothetical protein